MQATPTTEVMDWLCWKHTRKYSDPSSAIKNADSVIGTACRYRMFGLSANTAADAALAARLSESRSVAANRKVVAITKQIAEGIAPASPVHQSVSSATNGSMSRCGKGNQTVPSCSAPGV